MIGRAPEDDKFGHRGFGIYRVTLFILPHNGVQTMRYNDGYWMNGSDEDGENKELKIQDTKLEVELIKHI